MQLLKIIALICRREKMFGRIVSKTFHPVGGTFSAPNQDIFIGMNCLEIRGQLQRFVFTAFKGKSIALYDSNRGDSGTVKEAEKRCFVEPC